MEKLQNFNSNNHDLRAKGNLQFLPLTQGEHSELFLGIAHPKLITRS